MALGSSQLAGCAKQPSGMGMSMQKSRSRLPVTPKLPLWHSISCCLAAKLYLTLLQRHGLKPPTLRCPWNSPGKNKWVATPFAQGIFPAHGSKLCLLRWQVDSLSLSHRGSLAFILGFFNSHRFCFGSFEKYVTEGHLWVLFHCFKHIVLRQEALGQNKPGTCVGK